MPRNFVKPCNKFLIYSTRDDDVFEQASIIAAADILSVDALNPAYNCVDGTKVCSEIAAAPTRVILFEGDEPEFMYDDLTDTKCENDANQITLLNWAQLWAKSKLCPDPDSDLYLGNIGVENPIGDPDPSGLGSLAAQWLSGTAGCPGFGWETKTCWPEWTEIFIDKTVDPDVTIVPTPDALVWDLTNWDDPAFGIEQRLTAAGFTNFYVEVEQDATTGCNHIKLGGISYGGLEATKAARLEFNVTTAVAPGGTTTASVLGNIVHFDGLEMKIYDAAGAFIESVTITSATLNGANTDIVFTPTLGSPIVSGDIFRDTVSMTVKMSPEQHAYVDLAHLNRCYMEMGRFQSDFVSPILTTTTLPDPTDNAYYNIMLLQWSSFASELALIPVLDLAGTSDGDAEDLLQFAYNNSKTNGVIIHNSTLAQETTLQTYVETNGLTRKCDKIIPTGQI